MFRVSHARWHGVGRRRARPICLEIPVISNGAGCAGPAFRDARAGFDAAACSERTRVNSPALPVLEQTR